MNTIRIMNKKGDDTLKFNPNNPVQVAEAEQKFNELKGQGYSMFSVDPETKETTLVKEFFKDLPQVVAVPQISGG